MNYLKHLTAAALFVLGFSIFSSSTHACTGIKVKSEDGSVIFARTVEFGVDGGVIPAGIPAGTKLVASAPENKPGLSWTAKYAAIGIDIRGTSWLIEGLN